MQLIKTDTEINDLIKLITKKKSPIRLGFTGVPPTNLWEKALSISDEIIDLDMPLDTTDLSLSQNLVPKICCATLRTIVANTLACKNLDWIIMSSGLDKCDGGRFIALCLQKVIDTPIILTENLNLKRQGNPICESGLPLLEKMHAITDSLIKKQKLSLKKVMPKFGFWGVPPNDFEILRMFPDETHIFGWARCMENGTPADFELETFVNPDIPTVFFAQAFCPKNIFAYNLAKKFNGLYVEVDSKTDRSIKAKIEAFLWLSEKGSF